MAEVALKDVAKVYEGGQATVKNININIPLFYN
jgi:hypothetical protein